MKILYLNYLYGIKGHSLGSAIKPLELFAALREFGYEIKICWMKKQPAGGAAATPTLRTRLKKKLTRYIYDFKTLCSNGVYFLKALHLANEFKPDIIVGRIERCLVSDLLLARVKKVPFILEADCPAVYEALKFQKNYHTYKFINKWIEKINVRLADEVIVVSERMQWYFSQYGRDTSRIAIVTNGADSEKFSPSIRADAVRSQCRLTHSVTLGFIGSFNSWHGIQNLAELMLHLTRQNPGITFLLVGEGGKMKSWLEEFIETHDLTAAVIFAGYVDYADMPRYVAAMDIVLAPYPNLPFFYYSPVKLFEYMAAGKAIVTTKLGQIAEVIDDGVDGVLCAPDDAEEMGRRVAELITKPQLRRNMGEAARRKVVTSYLWKHKAAEWRSLLERAVAKNTRSGRV